MEKFRAGSELPAAVEEERVRRMGGGAGLDTAAAAAAAPSSAAAVASVTAGEDTLAFLLWLDSGDEAGAGGTEASAADGAAAVSAPVSSLGSSAPRFLFPRARLPGVMTGEDSGVAEAEAAVTDAVSTAGGNARFVFASTAAGTDGDTDATGADSSTFSSA